MDFAQFIASEAPAIAEGAVLEILRRSTDLVLDPHVLHGGFIYDPKARALLTDIHAGYMKLAREACLPMLAFTDTWRCSQRAIAASPCNGRPVNQDNARYLLELRDTFGEGPPIFAGGTVGPSGDAYKAEEGLDRLAARDFHRPQIEALAGAGLDFLHLATAPNVREALGIADVMAESDLPYTISFVIRRTGTVLDGTPLGDAIHRIDTEARRPPTGYSINCVHAQVLEKSLDAMAATHPGAARRILIFQANTADAEVEELDNSSELVTEPASIFADHLAQLRGRFGLRILGGCCGTGCEHIEALARTMRG